MVGLLTHTLPVPYLRRKKMKQDWNLERGALWKQTPNKSYAFIEESKSSAAHGDTTGRERRNLHPRLTLLFSSSWLSILSIGGA